MGESVQAVSKDCFCHSQFVGHFVDGSGPLPSPMKIVKPYQRPSRLFANLAFNPRWLSLRMPVLDVH
jgi:hypothetical protein